MQSTTTERRWRTVIAEQERSGLSVREFAEERGLSPWSLYTWRSKLGLAGRRRSVKAGRRSRRSEIPQDLVAVEIVGGATSPQVEELAFEIDLGRGVRVRVPSGFDGDELARLLSTLQSSC
jgi:hypothetical protein